MAGNNSIQILRSANLAASANKTQVPLAGQPLYDETTRRLYVGDGATTAENLSAVVASHSATTNRVTAYYGEVASNESAHSIDITSISGSPVRINSANMVDILGNLGLNIRTNMSHTNLNISAAAANSNIYLRSGHTTVLMGGNILATDVSNVNISASYFRVDTSSGSNLTVSTDAVLNAARRLSLNGTYANIEASDAIFVQSFSPTAGMSNITLNGSSINIAGSSVRINGASGNYISIGGAISMSSYSTGIAGYQFSVSTSLTNIGSSTVNFTAGPKTIYLSGHSLANSMWPIGAIFISAVSTNPGTLLGFGTWTQFGQGQVLVGYNASDSDFNTLLGTGGEKTHRLSTSEMPGHTHGQQVADASGSAIRVGWYRNGGVTSVAQVNFSSTKGATVSTTSSGSGNAHNNLQPYIVVYMWRRTA